MKGEATEYGFIWGPVEVERSFSDKKKGWVVLTLRTGRQEMQVCVTPTGLIRCQAVRRGKK
jgi:hypothetical protein